MPRKRLGQLLTELKVIDEHQLQSALGHQKQWGGKLGVILVQKGFCREEQMVSALSQHLAMPAVRLSEVNIDPRAVKTVSRSVAERLHVFAYEVTGSGRSEVITIAMSDPTDLSAVDQLAFHTGKRIKPMLAGDSELIAAIQQHYVGVETPGQGVQPVAPGSRPFLEGASRAAGARLTPVAPLSPVSPAATPTPHFSKRVEPPRGPPPVMQVAPAVEASDPAVAGGNGIAAPVEALDLSGEDLPADAPMDGLEPIAAHTQGEESVQGAEEVAEQGAPSDEVAGLEAVNPDDAVGAVDVQAMDGLEAAVPPAAPRDAAPEGSAAEGGWTVTSELPVDAIMGTADVLETAPEGGAATEAPDAWSDIADPLAAAEGTPEPQEDAAPDGAAPEHEEWDHGTAGEGGGTAESAWAQAAADVAAAAADLAAAEQERAAEGESLLAPPGDSYEFAEEVAIEAEGWTEEPAPATDEAQAEAGAARDAPFVMEEDTGPAEAEHGATQRQRWLSQRIAAVGEESDEAAADQPEAEAMYGEDAQEGAAEEEASSGEPAVFEEGAASEQGTGEEGAGPEQGYGEEAAAESGYAEAGASEEPRADEYGQQELAEDESAAGSEGWIASPEDQPQAAGWFGDALSSTMPLSPADLGTLAALGLEPSDGASAQRVLACLVRVLNRRQAIDLDELAAEIRESRVAGEAAAQAQVEEQPAGGELGGAGETGDAAE